MAAAYSGPIFAASPSGQLLSPLFERLQSAVGDAYRLERELAGGGMSRLFLATERALGRPVVVKVLPPELGSEVSAARFRREIELAARLQHPNILGVLTAGVDGDLVWYAMPYVEGESLRRRMDRDGPLPVSTATRLLREVADALSHAHERGVIHRDVKPENILFAADHALLADFGIAHALGASRGDERLTASGLSLGTPGYMAPEQAAGGAIDARTDLYALGLVGWEMLVGAPPFTGADAQSILAAHLTQPAPPLRERRGDVPENLSRAIARTLEKDPATRFSSAAEFRDALETTTARAATSWRTSAVVGAPLVLALATVAIWRVTRSNTKPSLDPNVVAVAPFDVHDAELGLWREGLADVLSRNLDGAGSLRSVPPTVVVRRWTGLADGESARRLAERTGAGLALFGALTRAGPDSVRLRATFLDMESGRTLPEIDLRDDAEHIDRLADSAAVALLRELGRTRPVGAARLTSIGSRSMPALKAFLRGEQLYRRGFNDSARKEYDRAVVLDTTFGLAFNRLGETIAWLTGDLDSLSLGYRLRAGAFTHGLARRDSLLLLADSNHAAGVLAPSDTATWRFARRTLALLKLAAREYPSEPQIWYELGEQSMHQVRFAPAPAAEILARFERAIDIDSQFAPAYVHALELAAAAHDTARFERLSTGYRRWKQAVGEHPQIAVLEAILARGKVAFDSAAPNLHTAHGLTESLGYMVDSTELGVVVARRYYQMASEAGTRVEHAKEHLASALAYRGQVRQAAALDVRNPRFIVELTLLGGLSTDSAAALFDAWQRAQSPSARLALPYWAMRGDTASARAMLVQLEQMARRAPPPLGRALALQEVAEARFFLALARRDTAAAVGIMPQLADSLCLDGCDMIRFAKGRVAAYQRRYAEAQSYLTPSFRTVVAPLTPLFALERARLAERAGDRERALSEYAYVARAWRKADPEVHSYQVEAEQAVERLGGRLDTPALRTVPQKP